MIGKPMSEMGGNDEKRLFQNIINHSPDISPDQDKTGTQSVKFKRPPLPSIHLTSSKYLNGTGKTFKYMKRDSSTKVMHDKKTLLGNKEKGQDIHAGDWKSIANDRTMSAKERNIKVK